MADKDDKKKDDNPNKELMEALAGLSKLPDLINDGFANMQKSMKTQQQAAPKAEPKNTGPAKFTEKSLEEVERMTNTELMEYWASKSAHENAALRDEIKTDRKSNADDKIATNLAAARKDLPHFAAMEEHMIQMVTDDPSLKNLSFTRLYEIAKNEHADTFKELSKDDKDENDPKGGDDKDNKDNAFGGMKPGAAAGSGDDDGDKDKEYDSNLDAAEAAWDNLGMDAIYEQ